uniref:Uncharacterized protein n=1 Tax=viral metagenome TaxID=1070528 RepID=A0A6M3MFD7_9ZZZZ
MEEGNSIRDTLKDRFRVLLAMKMGHDEAYEMSCDLADAAFDVLGMSPEMQDKPEEPLDKIKCFVDHLMAELSNEEIVRIMRNCNLEDEDIETFMNK